MASVELIDEPVPVEARLLPDGHWRPLAFQWRGRRHPITDIGRQWQDDAEGVSWRCYMVRTAGGSAFELRHDETTGRWQLARAWPPRSFA